MKQVHLKRMLLLALLLVGVATGLAVDAASKKKATIVLVHGAFADASSWNGVIGILEKNGFDVVAVANPLRGVKSDSAYVSSLVAGIPSPVVLVGHSYGGNVITNAANGHANVKALVYVSAFAPEVDEAAAALSAKFPGSSLGSALAPPVALTDGTDLYIQKDKFHDQFAADVSQGEASLMAATQRPITVTALNENSGAPAWKSIPSWFIYGDKDRNIPPETMAFMAARARAVQSQVIAGASHVVMVSHPGAVAHMIESAAAAK